MPTCRKAQGSGGAWRSVKGPSRALRSQHRSRPVTTCSASLAHGEVGPRPICCCSPSNGIARSHHGTTPLESSNGRRLARRPNGKRRAPGCGKGWPDSCWSAISIHHICPSEPHVVRGALRQANEVCHTVLRRAAPNHSAIKFRDGPPPPLHQLHQSAVSPSKHTCLVPRRSWRTAESCCLDRGRMRRAAVKSVSARPSQACGPRYRAPSHLNASISTRRTRQDRIIFVRRGEHCDRSRVKVDGATCDSSQIPTNRRPTRGSKQRAVIRRPSTARTQERKRGPYSWLI